MNLNKSTFRKKCLKKLKNGQKHNRFYKNALINKKLLELIKSKKRLDILFYYPLGLEADIRKSLQALRKKHSVYTPFMVEQSFKMVPFRLPLRKRKFNILEAGDTNLIIKKIDIAIVPTIGIDGNLQRVGFGKGMYDRFFEKLQKKPYTIFTQLELCYTEAFICDAYDISCDILITPKKTLIKRKKIMK